MRRFGPLVKPSDIPILSLLQRWLPFFFLPPFIFVSVHVGLTAKPAGVFVPALPVLSTTLDMRVALRAGKLLIPSLTDHS